MPHDHITKTIELVQAQVHELDQQLLEKKRMVNDLCKLAGRESMYSDADLTTSATTTSVRPDEYYGKAQATVVRAILERRKSANLGAATVPEIYEEMVSGGYSFSAKNDENSKRGLYISLGKNTATFHKLPNGTYGLLEWYPDAKSAKSNGSSKPATQNEKPLHEELQEEDSPSVTVSATRAKAK